MKILLIYPRYPDTFWSFKHALRFISKKAVHPPLGLLTVAALLPGQWKKRLVDTNIRALTNADLEWADWVFLSAMSVQRKSTREIIDRCKTAGVKTVAGGPLFSAGYGGFEDVDHLFVGEAEQTMPVFLDDLERGEARRVYTASEFPDVKTTPAPIWSLADKKKYVSMNIQYSRGCPFDCDFCDITALYGRRVRTKSTEQVLAELEQLHAEGWRGNVFFVDDNFIGNRRKLKAEVLPAMISWMEKRRYPFVFSTEASINLADDEELMKLMNHAGFNSVFIGIETPNEEGLAECSKLQNKGRDLIASVNAIQRAGLRVKGGFIVGFDSDSPRIFERQIEFIRRSGIITAMVGLLNAPRGTRLYQRVKREGRLLNDISGDNTDCSINFVPQMGYETLAAGYREIIRGIYAPKPYYRRVRAFLSKYRPKMKKRFHLGYIRFHFGYPGALFRSIILLGIKDKARAHFWKLFFWSLIKRPTLFPLAMTYAIYGFHFRKVFASCF